MPDLTPTLAVLSGHDGLCARPGGCWSAARLAVPATWAGIEQALSGVAVDASGAAGASVNWAWDLSALQRLDHTGAQLLWNAWGHRWPRQLVLQAHHRAMLERVAQYTTPAPPSAPTLWVDVPRRIGQNLWLLLDHAHAMLRLLGQLLLDVITLARAPQKGPWRDVSGHVYRIGATALPVTALVGFMIGMVLAYLIARQLRQYGANTFIVTILGVALIREIGPILAAILIAGRSGSAMTAQIGVMRVTEELDAMRVMGIAKGFRLVLPRTIAMTIAMPLVAVWTTMAALLGGVWAADAVLGVTPSHFFATLPAVVQIGNLWLALCKSLAFGVAIALIACHYGLRVRPDTDSLGQGTTASVVTSITVVLLMDAGFAVIFKNIGL